MSMYTPPKQGATEVTHSLLGMWCAWVSVFLPVVAGLVYLFVCPAWYVAPDVIYWASFIAGVISFALGCAGISTIGRRIDWMVLTPALVGIAMSLALCYFTLTFGILGATGPVPSWNQIFPSQGPPPGQHW